MRGNALPFTQVYKSQTLPVPVIVLTARRLNVQCLQPLVPRIVTLVEAGGLSGFYRIAGDPGAHVADRA